MKMIDRNNNLYHDLQIKMLSVYAIQIVTLIRFIISALKYEFDMGHT